VRVGDKEAARSQGVGDPGLGLLVRDGDVDVHAVPLRARDFHSLAVKARALTRRVAQVVVADLAVGTWFATVAAVISRA